ncbi:MAG: hypothetical protein N2578_03800 [Bdellovibrionaceae bacterium]|nr:hypothetical protein [Pseudobdellovibrionaceae bacterium]
MMRVFCFLLLFQSLAVKAADFYFAPVSPRGIISESWDGQRELRSAVSLTFSWQGRSFELAIDGSRHSWFESLGNLSILEEVETKGLIFRWVIGEKPVNFLLGTGVFQSTSRIDTRLGGELTSIRSSPELIPAFEGGVRGHLTKFVYWETGVRQMFKERGDIQILTALGLTL